METTNASESDHLEISQALKRLLRRNKLGTIADIETADRNRELQEINGIGPKRAEAIRKAVAKYKADQKPAKSDTSKQTATTHVESPSKSRKMLWGGLVAALMLLCAVLAIPTPENSLTLNWGGQLWNAVTTTTVKPLSPIPVTYVEFVSLLDAAVSDVDRLNELAAEYVGQPVAWEGYFISATERSTNPNESHVLIRPLDSDAKQHQIVRCHVAGGEIPYAVRTAPEGTPVSFTGRIDYVFRGGIYLGDGAVTLAR